MPPKKTKSAVVVDEDESNGLTDTLLKEILTAVRANGEKLSENTTKLANLENKYESLSLKLEATDSRLTKVETENNAVNDVVNHYKQAIRSMEIDAIRNEENSKRFNIVLYNIREGASTHENRKTSFQIVHDVLDNAFGIDPKTIDIAEAHRLPAKSGKGRKPLIFKLTSMLHKDILWDHLQNVKTYNDKQKEGEKISVNMTHLPSKLMKDKDDLKDIYDQAKAEGKSPKWPGLLFKNW